MIRPPDVSRPYLPPATLVLGGQRSGKSLYAEGLIEPFGAGLYLATAEARDGEMAERLRRHRARRGPTWETVEEPVAIVSILRARAAAERPVLVDCVTLWLSNLFERGLDAETEVAGLVAALPRLRGPVVLVSNEIGLGVVPENALARSFVDALGLANQALARACDRVVMMAAGLPTVLKEPAAAAASGRAVKVAK